LTSSSADENTTDSESPENTIDKSMAPLNVDIEGAVESSMETTMKDLTSPTQVLDIGSDTSPVTHSESIESLPTSNTAASIGNNKGKEKGKKKDRLPKLTVRSYDDTVAECVFDTHKNEKITFRFGLKEDAPEDIALKMIDANHRRVDFCIQ
jgi:cytoskeletal protein RodZ